MIQGRIPEAKMIPKMIPMMIHGRFPLKRSAKFNVSNCAGFGRSLRGTIYVYYIIYIYVIYHIYVI